MNIAYMSLAGTVLASFLIKNQTVLWIGFILSGFLGVFQGIVSPLGLVFLGVLWLMAKIYFKIPQAANLLSLILFLGLIGLTLGFAFHLMPGFSNTLLYDKIHVSSLSSAFTMYLNFDKVMAALILFGAGKIYLQEQRVDSKALGQTGKMLIVCTSTILGPALLSNYIQLDPKIPDILGVWALNNLLFVAFAEEVIFRGVIQRTLRSFFDGNTRFLPIALASLIFGLSHFGIGKIYILLASLGIILWAYLYSKSTYKIWSWMLWIAFILPVLTFMMYFKGATTYVILSSICGLFYGYTYDKTNRIFCSMVVHFGLNLIHILLFTYPAFIR